MTDNKMRKVKKFIGNLKSLPSSIGNRQTPKGELEAYRPRFNDWHFWAVQVLVVGVAVMHYLIEESGLLEGNAATADHSLSWVPVAMFFIPVVYAALNFGFAGSVATALWCTILAMPNTFIFHHDLERIAEVLQLGIVDALAVFVGLRVDREWNARQRAEESRKALTASESRYRGLFESNPIAVMVLSSNGTIMEANPAASVLLERNPVALRGIAINKVLGSAGAEKLLAPPLDGNDGKSQLVLRRGDGSQVYLTPILTHTGDQGKSDIEVLLKDVTEERHRQAGLRAYAAHILKVQEEERKRVSQELHDETVQELVLLCRQLDLVERAGKYLPASAINRLQKARSSAESIVERLRDFARALRPPILDDLGLVSSIRKLLADLSERTNMEGDLEVVGQERRLSANSELALFRIAQEALHNVEHHSRATKVTATIVFGEADVKLTIMDNGTGFSLPQRLQFGANGKLGLLGMGERAESAGGRLDIESSPGEGTLLRASIPDGTSPTYLTSSFQDRS